MIQAVARRAREIIAQPEAGPVLDEGEAKDRCDWGCGKHLRELSEVVRGKVDKPPCILACGDAD